MVLRGSRTKNVVAVRAAVVAFRLQLAEEPSRLNRRSQHAGRGDGR